MENERYLFTESDKEIMYKIINDAMNANKYVTIFISSNGMNISISRDTNFDED